jgi:hypothetical protein
MANTDIDLNFDRSTTSGVPVLPNMVGSGQDYIPTPDEWRVSSGQVSKYPQELGTPGPFEKLVLFEVKSARHIGQSGIAENGGGANVKDSTVAAVALYLPESALKSDIEAQYDTSDLGPFMGMLSEFTAQTDSNYVGRIANAIQSVPQELADAYANSKGVLGTLGAIGGTLYGEGSAALTATTDVLSEGFRKLATAPNIGQASLAAAIAALERTPLGAGANQMSGQRVNPRTDILFNHMGYRTHVFDFMLIPRNEAEAKAIDTIVHMFQYYMLPSYSPNLTDGVSGALIGFPYEFTITFWSQGRPNTHHINTIGRSVLRAASVNHAAAGKNAFFKGSQGDVYPAATSLSLTFQEVRLLSRESQEIDRALHTNMNTADPNGKSPLSTNTQKENAIRKSAMTALPSVSPNRP